MPQQVDDNNRLRTPPRIRFQGNERLIDLREAFARLPAESVARDGHMQKALYRWGPMTTAIFAFDVGGEVPCHDWDGGAMIHILSGRMQVETESGAYEAGPDHLLLLDPSVKRRLTALEPTRLLLTVVLPDQQGGDDESSG